MKCLPDYRTASYPLLMMRQTFARLGRMHQFAALQHRGFRLLWIATLLSATARWADMVVIGWLTLELTNSPLMVVIADRVDRRLLLLIAAVVNVAVSALMLVLFVSDALALWHVISLAVV